ncbi:MAG TPA: penicillin acylase family protein [Steroidobacteraceae bacterium]|nr:penicillin acylase family protein [Steroidobacteraceae bacterium]
MRWLRWTLAGLAALALVAFGLAWWAMHRSLPQLDGHLPVEGLRATADIERDARGIPVITARTRVDLAFATGFAHAQDRFFQMDLSRRLAAGELSELFGAVALRQDVRTRRFGFRAVARRVVEAAPAAQRAIIESYARGVNAGLASLGARPWEYLLLRAVPRAWQPEDSVLVVHSMWWQLQHGTIVYEIGRRRLERAAAQRATPEAARALIEFVYSGYGPWDTPNYSADARCLRVACGRGARKRPFPALLRFGDAPAAAADDDARPGSNGWAIAGTHTRSGVALVANDMHLELGVPTVWYPARLRLDGERMLDVTGVTLPGTPAMVAGSNGAVAWGFTNSYGDFADVRFGPCADAAYGVRTEHIAVRGADSVAVQYREAGPAVVLDGDEFAADVARGECLQVAWLATRPEATNFELFGMETADSVDAALALAPRVGIPAQNLVVGDRGGRIAWTLFGRVPRTSGPERYFGELEYRDASDHPRLVDPPVGRLWTANQRVVEGPLEAAIGDDELEVGAGGYDIGARARQIRDDLVALDHPATEKDMLAIQLDARALFLRRWRDLLLTTLEEGNLQEGTPRREFRDLISNWNGEASPDSVGYRLVRTFRSQALGELWNALVANLLGADVKLKRAAPFEMAGWRLLSERPAGIAPPDAPDWKAFLLQEIDVTIDKLVEQCGALARCAHGYGQPLRIRHPLSEAIPGLSWLLDMPAVPRTGDNHMPRVEDGNLSASERFAVSPGRESEGYLELPGGPSGHPLSPFYRSGFEDWAAGRPAPFLPGLPAHRLELRPR